MTAFRFEHALLLAAAMSLAACKERNAYVPPPPPQVSVAVPTQQKVTRYLEVTGNTAPVASVDLVARVQGFLQDILYTDGKMVKKGDQLFIIEPLPYLTKLQQAQSAQTGAQALLTNTQIEFDRQQTLVRQNVSAQRSVDDARQARDQAQAALDQDNSAVQTAAINYSYTRVIAPFDGVVSAHLQSVGQLVGTTPTQLATIVQQDPIYVNFTVSETDVLHVQQQLRARAGTQPIDLSKVPVEVGLQDEQGYPHTGTLDYVAPTVDQNTGTLQARGILNNANRAMLPGFFARVRIPIERDVNVLMVPQTAIGADQAGRYVLVVDPDGTVQQRSVMLGDIYGEQRAVLSGLKPDDRVVVAGIQRAVPGSKVDAQTKTAAR